MRGRMNGHFITACHISVIILDSHPAALHDAIKNNSRNTKTHVERQRGIGISALYKKLPKSLHSFSFGAFSVCIFLEIWFRCEWVVRCFTWSMIKPCIVHFRPSKMTSRPNWLDNSESVAEWGLTFRQLQDGSLVGCEVNPHSGGLC